MPAAAYGEHTACSLISYDQRPNVYFFSCFFLVFFFFSFHAIIEYC